MAAKPLNGEMDSKDYKEESQEKEGSKVDITESENSDPGADTDLARTPGKAEGVENPEREGNE